MLKIKLSIVLFTLAGACFSAVASKASNTDQHIQHWKHVAAIPGISFGFVKKGGQPQLISLGLADSDKQVKVSPDTIFQAASLSKPVLAYMVLKLAEQGKLSLDQPLHQILDNPRIKNKQWGKRLTARLVLSHQTGFANWSRGDLTFQFEPGKGFGYSGEGYVYLQQVVEKLSGKSFETLAQELVFAPLKMRNSYFTWDKKANLKLAQGHDRAGQQVGSDIPKANAAASLHTTASDYLKFVQGWFDTNNLKVASRRAAFTVEATKVQGEPVTTMGWGLGWGIHEHKGSKIAWHWGDNGVFRAFVAVDVQTQRAYVYFANSQNGLAIVKPLTERFFPGNLGIVDWLGYGQADSPLWQAERQGYELAAKGHYAKAQQAFEKVLKQFPDNQRLKNKIRWIEPLADSNPKAIELNQAMLDKIAGQYGERKLFVVQGQLKYQRGEGNAHSLTPFYRNVFKVGDLQWFRLEVVFDDNGKPVKLVGWYEDGFQDESDRTGD